MKFFASSELPVCGFVADGPERYASTTEYKMKKKELWAAIVAKYAEQLAQLGFLRRLGIRLLMRREFQRACRKIRPSEYTLW